MSGACVRRARLHAADGAPIPTKQTSLLLSDRAATIVIISLAVNVPLMPSSARSAPPIGEESLRTLAQDVLAYPFLESCAVARDIVPGNVKTVRTPVIP